MPQITEGSGRILVTAVGVDSEWGRTMALVAEEAEETPLQVSLRALAAAIGKVGLAVGAICFVVLMIRRAPAVLNPSRSSAHGTRKWEASSAFEEYNACNRNKNCCYPNVQDCLTQSLVGFGALQQNEGAEDDLASMGHCTQVDGAEQRLSSVADRLWAP